MGRPNRHRRRKLTPQVRLRVMRSIRSTGTRPERLLYATVKRVFGGARVLRYPRWLRGHPDVYIPKLRLALFCDGCFFHGCEKHYRIPPRNSTYWQGKVEGNAKRDRAVSKALRRSGISVWRIWEHDCQPGTEGGLEHRLRVIRNRVQHREGSPMK